MAETPERRWYCLVCGADNPSAALMCRRCAGGYPAPTADQERRGVAFFLNELTRLNADGEVDDDLYRRLTLRYRERLGTAPRETAPARRAAAPRKEAAAPKEPAGPTWLAEQQANLLLYLGAFMIVVASLIFVSASGESIGDNVRMAMLALGTLLFLAAGYFFLHVARVRQAGVVFFAVGSLMVPICFVGAYGLYLADDGVDPTGLWLAGSLASAVFYSAVALLGIGRWYAIPMVIAALSGLSAALALAGAAPEAYPGTYIAAALVLAAPSLTPVGRVRDTFGPICLGAAHLIVPPAALIALAMTGAAEGDGEFELVTRWYLPPTGALAALFYWLQARWARRSFPPAEAALTISALAVTAGAAVTIVFAMEVGEQWYGVAVAMVAWLYAGAGRLKLNWTGRSFVDLMALGAITASWALFSVLYGDSPRIGAGVHFSAAAFYLIAARLATGDYIDLPLASQDERASLRLEAGAALAYAAGLVVGIGYYHLLSSLPAADAPDAGASDLALPFFGLSLGVGAIAATMRWWWPEVRTHIYVIAAAMSLFVLLSAAEAEGQVTALLAVYAAAALALALWEREPFALALPATYGFFGVLAAWRFYEPTDQYLPLAVAAIGCTLFAVSLAMRERDVTWSHTLLALAFAYLLAAPVAGWVRLAALADPDGFIGDRSFEETALYQTSAAAVLILGVLAAVQGWLMRRWETVAGASALLMVALLLEIGHFRPENAQAYTAPLGVYLMVGATLVLRVRDVSAEVRALVEPVQALGAAVLLGPSLVQGWADDGWPYALLLLGEAVLILGVALVQRWLWPLGTATGFLVLDALRYLFNGAQLLPSWATLALAGALIMAAGVAILLARERWTRWQQAALAWWRREPLVSTSG